MQFTINTIFNNTFSIIWNIKEKVWLQLIITGNQLQPRAMDITRIY